MADLRGMKRKRRLMLIAAAAAFATLTANIAFIQSKHQDNSNALDMSAVIDELDAADADTTAREVSRESGVTLKTEVESVARDGKARTNVAVDGKRIHVPKNGSVHKVYRSNGNKTEVRISSNSVSSGNNSSTTVTNLNISAETSSQKSQAKKISP